MSDASERTKELASESGPRDRGSLAALSERYRAVMDRIAAAAQKAGRRPKDVLCVAVSKYTDLDDIRHLIDLGHRDFGESQVQQLVQRATVIDEERRRRREMPSLEPGGGPSELFSDRARGDAETDQPVRWHMVGHLQRNKVKKCVDVTRLIHSVDSLRLVDEIHSVAFKRDIEVELLVQVNTTGEEQKFGCAPAAAQHLCEQIDSLVHLKVRGLMAMGPTSQDERDTRLAFDRARELFDEIAKLKLCEGRFNILSMGMSGDYELAIEHGANMVRVGSGIFGARRDEQDHDGDSNETAHGQEHGDGGA